MNKRVEELVLDPSILSGNAVEVQEKLKRYIDSLKNIEKIEFISYHDDFGDLVVKVYKHG